MPIEEIEFEADGERTCTLMPFTAQHLAWLR